MPKLSGSVFNRKAKVLAVIILCHDGSVVRHDMETGVTAELRSASDKAAEPRHCGKVRKSRR